jgi:hypothetical protein
MAKTIGQLTALGATPDDSDNLVIDDSGVTKKVTAGQLKGDCVRGEQNNALSSTVGTKIGTNANQLLGFWNATPVDQPAVTADLLDSLQEVGLIAAGAGDTPLNLSAGALTCGGIAAGADINTTEQYLVDSVQVVSNRATGWAAPTGTATRTTFVTSTVTTAQLAERVKALIDDLTTHGLIGPS